MEQSADPTAQWRDSRSEHWTPTVDDLVDTTEMYLKSIYELIEEGIVPLRARIAERLGQTGPTVSGTVARMERDGYLVVDADRRLELTEEGWERATAVMRKHRLAERLLADCVGLEWPYLHEEACRWEHVMSDRVEDRLIELLGDPRFDPYGNPIPRPGEEATGLDGAWPEGADDIGAAVPVDGARPLAEVTWSEDGSPAEGADAGSWAGHIARLAEPLQTDTGLLAQFEQAGVLPGVHVRVARRPGAMSLTAEGSQSVLDVPEEVARHIFVTDRG